MCVYLSVSFWLICFIFCYWSEDVPSAQKRLLPQRNSFTDVYIYIYVDSKNRDLLNESFHVCAEHATISGVSLKFKPRIANIYLHGKQNIVMGGVKHEMVNDVLTRSCNDGDMRVWT